MSNLQFAIKSYIVAFQSGNETSDPEISITLENGDGPNATINFVQSNNDIIPAHTGQLNQVFAYYHKDRYPEVIDLLRNEGPLTFLAVLRNPATAHVMIYSGFEPIGEGDL